MSRRLSRSVLAAAEGRTVSTGSVFSTILLTRVLSEQATFCAERLVDVGCGASPYRHLVPARSYVGVDWAPAASDPIGTVAGDALALPFADRSFDGILCTEVIEHVPDERDLVAELARVAAPGATMLLSSPFVHGLHEAPQDFRRLTSLGLVTALAASGWEVDRMVAIGGPAVVTIDSWCRWFDSTFRRAARAIRRRPGPVVVGISRIVQQALAATVLATPGWARRPIDPDLPLPRITLGYVVLARLVT